ncbi:MAG: hypothetical protein C0624_03450 [Desulfuromonas sp.]|nr:MAG: hypothetical protein C0624_03450 [Desulfuromonas sp.]
MKMKKIEQRQDDLEVRLTYQQRTIDELNEVVIELADRVRQLELDNGRLKEMLATLAPEPGISPDE